MDKNTVPDNFTVTLALVDAIPVLFFGASMIVISRLFDSTLFLIGAIICTLSGALKVLWKMIVAVKKKNVWFLFLQMRIAMPIGFLLLIASLFVDHSKISLSAIGKGLLSFPSCIFFLIGFAGMICMCIFAKKLDSSDSKSNWIEQLTNGIAQICFFIGLLLLM